MCLDTQLGEVAAPGGGGIAVAFWRNPVHTCSRHRCGSAHLVHFSLRSGCTQRPAVRTAHAPLMPPHACPPPLPACAPSPSPCASLPARPFAGCGSRADFLLQRGYTFSGQTLQSLGGTTPLDDLLSACAAAANGSCAAADIGGGELKASVPAGALDYRTSAVTDGTSCNGTYAPAPASYAPLTGA